MERLIEFAGNHPFLVSAFFLLWFWFFWIESRRGGASLTPQQATNQVNREDGVFVDLRDEDEFRQGHIAGSINIPASRLADRLGELKKYQDKPVVLVCKMGNSASAAGKTLKTAGFERVARLQGGLQAWRTDKLPVVKA